jgi:hypothetical protein
MHEYRVVERWVAQERYALQCHKGRYHLARALNAMPPVAVLLHSTPPRIGFGVLLNAASGAMFRVIFESVNDEDPAPYLGRCGEQVETWEHLGASRGFSGRHPSPPAPGGARGAGEFRQLARPCRRP